MADEQAQAELPASEEIQEQTPAAETTVSEDVQTPSPETGKGDVTEALRQAREELRSLKQGLADPSFIYQQARQLGLTEEEARDQAEGVPVKSQPQESSYSQYKYFREIEKSQEKYPQLADDEEDQLAITALMQAKGLSPMAAADRYYAKMNRVVEAAKTEGAKAKEATISEKEMAQTVTSTTSTNSDSAEYEDILRRTRDHTKPKEAEKAHLELIRWKESHR